MLRGESCCTSTSLVGVRCNILLEDLLQTIHSSMCLIHNIPPLLEEKYCSFYFPAFRRSVQQHVFSCVSASPVNFRSYDMSKPTSRRRRSSLAMWVWGSSF